MLSGRGLYDRQITRTEESHRVPCDCVLSRNLNHKAVEALLGLLRHKTDDINATVCREESFLLWMHRLYNSEFFTLQFFVWYIVTGDWSRLHNNND